MIEKMTFEEYIEILKNSAKYEKDCPVRKTLKLFHGKWNTRVLFELSKKERCRFCDLKKLIPEITSTMLTSTLRELVSFGVVDRIQFNEIPPRVEYSLTDSGRELMPVFFEMAKWGEKYLL
ncbi:winged helix-turn-helix transcriptional regulator [Peptoniphilus stercorisuis]|uniref:DNA-binding HxlR family transcriptional regulator n=1 Tax=Peptoniphilus stercorisuis TaxID=1436965 RepID=A0ABS4KB16_9FIRM|nr:helix-turn-helix domain-containing protein [Peptoniphilus stercorisuis]MBP2024971.1 DNA-binding HxlR family transcriptional regulator [Peptoniphilus stercorisuis]